jgi:hypothetical protein
MVMSYDLEIYVESGFGVDFEAARIMALAITSHKMPEPVNRQSNR